MSESRSLRIFIIFLALNILLGACQKTPPVTPTMAPSATHFTQVSPTPRVTATEVEAASQTHSPYPTATELPPAATWEKRSYAGTALISVAKRVLPETAHQVIPLAVWGTGQVNDLTLSPDGLILAVATNLGAFFYDSQTYALLAFISADLPLHALVFSSDGLWVALAQDDGGVVVLNQNDFSPSLTLPTPEPPLAAGVVLHLIFSPDSRRLSLIAEEESLLTVFHWDTDTWEPTTSVSIPRGDATYINPTLDLVGGVSGQDLVLQSMTYPEENDRLDLPATIAPSFWTRLAEGDGQVIPSANGEFLLLSNGAAIVHWPILADGYTYLLDRYPQRLPDPCTVAPETCRDSQGSFSWDCPEDNSLPSIGLVALSPNDVMVLISRNDTRTEFRRAVDSVPLWEINASYDDVSFSPGGELFFGLRPDGTIEKRATSDGTLIDYIDQHPSQLYDLAFSPDGAVLAGGFSDGWIRVFSSANGQMLGVLNGQAQSLAFSYNGALLAAGLTDGTVRIFELEAGTFFDLSPRHLAAVTDLVFSPAGDQLLTGSADCTAALWKVKDRYRVRTIQPSADTPFRLGEVETDFGAPAFYFAGDPGVFISQGETLAQLPLNTAEPITSITIAPAVRILGILGESLWLQPDPGRQNPPKPIRIRLQPTNFPPVLASNPAGSVFATANLQAINFWSSQGDLLATLDLNGLVSGTTQPMQLAFSPQAALMAFGTQDGLIHIFGIPSEIGN